MIKKVRIVPRMAIHSLANEDKWYKNAKRQLGKYDYANLISINGNDEPLLTPEQINALRHKHKFGRIESYRFDDVGGAIWDELVRLKKIESKSPFILFDAKVAEHIVETFVEDQNSEDETLVVHCHAGISRSSAVGYAIACHEGLDSAEIKREHSYCDPNKHILKHMLTALGLTQEQYDKWIGN